MKPTEICTQILGIKKLETILAELSSPQIKATLKEGGMRAKLPKGYVSQQKKRKLWSSRILSAIDQANDDLAGELLQQWLLNHRRPMLIAFLDHLQVEHRQGETDDSFLVAQPREKIRQSSSWLMTQFDPTETSAYLHYIAFQQRSGVYDGWDGLAIPKAFSQ